MAFQTRKSRMAIVSETTEGTLVEPSASSDYIALQEGFTLTPDIETLENAELKASIGQAKSIQGQENPAASVQHYVRHSGTEGTAPNYKLLLKAAFGAEDVRSTERDVVSATAGTASAAATVTVDTGEGSEFERGDALLIKDGTNNYSIRPVKSVSGDVLTLGLNLGSAPAAGVELGLNVLYKPADSGHPTLSVWDYRANEAAIQAIAGSRVIEMAVEADANALMNASYSLEGTSFFYNPIVIDATNDDLDFNDGGGEENVSVTQKAYKDPHELADAIATAMNAATTDTITVTYSDSDGKYTIATSGATLSLLWNTGTNTATTIGGEIGFATAADDTGATSYESDNAITLSSPQTPSFDSPGDPLVIKNNEVFIGDFADTTCLEAQSVSWTLADEKTDVEDICSESGKSGSVLTGRTMAIEVLATLQQYDVDKFKRFRTNEETSFLFNFGTKSGGNWEAGKSGCLYVPTATISDFEVTDTDGLVTLQMTLTAFVDSDGNGEVYLNFV